jgi:copper homeostasis protein
MTRAILESVVETLEAAVAAEAAGTARLELCVDLPAGGTTPPIALVRAVTARVAIPVFVMVRPRGGGFVYSAAERAIMRRDIGAVAAAGAAGIVAGALLEDGRVDVDTTREMVEAASGLPVTFHRAFDEAPDPIEALEHVVDAGAARVLTSGGAPTAREGADVLAQLVRRGGDRIAIVAAGGVRAENVAALLARTRVREVHARFEDEAGTRRLVDLL